LLVLASISGPNLLATPNADKLGFVIEYKPNNACIELVPKAKRVANIDKLLNHDKALAKRDIRRNFMLRSDKLISFQSI
jgi:hypothetical protein